jgi:hypothetical protein
MTDDQNIYLASTTIERIIININIAVMEISRAMLDSGPFFKFVSFISL